MTGRIDREVTETHRVQIQRMLSCVTPGAVTGGGVPRRGFASRSPIRSITLSNGDPVNLRGIPRLTLRFEQHFVVVHTNSHERDQGRVEVVGYIYTFAIRDGPEVVAYHWHPQRTVDLPYPHVHFGPASARPDSAVRPGELHKVHFPTGIVTLAEVIRLAINEFRVEPRRDDWETILSSG